MDESSTRKSMQTAFDTFETDLSSVRTGRASPAMLQNINIKAYGGTQNLKLMELASITANDPQTLVVEPWDKSVIGEIRKGIEASNIGLTPSIDGEIIRLAVPAMTGEDREKYIKLISTKVENGRIMIRQVRAGTLKSIKNKLGDKEISGDEKFSEEKKLQDLTDEYINKIENLGKQKEEELKQL